MFRKGLSSARTIKLSVTGLRDPSRILQARLWLEMALGTVVVLVGQTGCGKTHFLNRLLPGRVINNVSLFARPAPIPLTDLPVGRFAIDEPQFHLRDDVARALESGTGCVLSFQAKGVFTQVGLEELLQERRVLILDVGSRSVLADQPGFVPEARH